MENRLIPQTFVTWAKKIIKEKSRFEEIKQERKPELNASGIVLKKKGNLLMHLHFGINGNDLSTVIESQRAFI